MTAETEVTLSDPENYAIAVFPQGDGSYTIVVGNVREGEAPDAFSLLAREAKRAFGSLKESGSAKNGHIPDRWDCWVRVAGTEQDILRFVRQRLGGGPSQFKLRPA